MAELREKKKRFPFEQNAFKPFFFLPEKRMGIRYGMEECPSIMVTDKDSRAYGKQHGRG